MILHIAHRSPLQRCVATLALHFEMYPVAQVRSIPKRKRIEMSLVTFIKKV